MTVTVEVPAGYKFCKVCGDVKPLGDFYVKRSRNPSTGNVSHYHEGKCKPCSNAATNACKRANYTPAVKVDRPPPRYLPPRPPQEVPCDMAFMQWQGGEPRQDWRVRV